MLVISLDSSEVRAVNPLAGQWEVEVTRVLFI